MSDLFKNRMRRTWVWADLDKKEESPKVPDLSGARRTWTFWSQRNVEEPSTPSNPSQNIKRQVLHWTWWGKKSWIWIVWWIWYITVFLLLVYPIILLFIIGQGDWNTYNWLLMQLYNNITYTNDSALSNSWTIIQFLTGLFGTVAIIAILFPPMKMDSWLRASLLQAGKAYSLLKESDLKNSDREKYNTVIFKIISYSIVFIWIFAIYYFMIYSIIEWILTKNIDFISLIWVLVQSLVIILINHFTLMGLRGIDPAPEKLTDDYIYDASVSEEDKLKWENSNGVLAWLILLAVNIEY